MNKSKAKGTRAESKVVKFLQGCGFSARRKALAGNADEGDIEVCGLLLDSPMVLEIKAGKQTACPNRTQLEEWLRQTEVEGTNSGQPSALVVVRYNRSIKDADVYIQHEHSREHMYLDEFASRYQE